MDASVKMLHGVAFGRVELIREAHAEGMDLDAEVPNTDGRTPLTEAILGGMGEPEAVRTLIELGADPDRRDGNGWSPWLACISREGDRVVAEEMGEIREILEQAGASTEDQARFDLYQAACDGDIDRVRELLDDGVSAECPQLCPLGAAVGIGHIDLVRFLLDRGAPVEGAGVEQHGQSCLMSAAGDGRFDLVRLLVERGADPARTIADEPDWTAAAFAEQGGHSEIAEWLAERSGTTIPGRVPEAARADGPRAKYAELYRLGVNGINFDLDTDAIVDRLMQWDERYGIDLVDIKPQGEFTVQFHRLDDDIDALASEIYDFCPDAVDQGFAAVTDALFEGRRIPDDMQQLVEGLDVEDFDFDLEVMKRWLRQHRSIALWWD